MKLTTYNELLQDEMLKRMAHYIFTNSSIHSNANEVYIKTFGLKPDGDIGWTPEILAHFRKEAEEYLEDIRDKSED